MSKNILAIVSSPRKGGNSERLCEEFIKGAEQAGNNTETIFLRDKKIAPCIACEACLNNGGNCVQMDDMADIIEKLVAADVVVLSTPVYYYSISAQLKTMIDRTLAGGGRLANKEFYLIATAADGKHAMEVTMSDMEGFVRCVPGSKVKGKVYGSAFRVGEIEGNPALSEAFKLGKNC
ncbi:iron-sulfur flavoprotein [Lachnospiraceae bacterium KM106-2]|nr:iron-sulfur flavoprotein [Lachnospiraceae bacterium KM106-2]